MAFNTGNPIGSTDPRDLSDNAENLDSAVNSSELAFTDRLGNSRKTLAGILSGIGYEAPIPYAGGISFATSDTTKTVEEAGVVYAPYPSALPFTTDGTFSNDAAKFYPLQGLINGDALQPYESISAIESLTYQETGDQISLSGSRGGIFKWDASDLSGTLILSSVTSTSVDSGTDTITSAGHGLVDGDGVVSQAAVNGLSLNTVYWVIGATANTFQLSSTPYGSAFDLTGTSNFTVDKLLDPHQGIYVAPSSDKTGASGAWVRQFGQSAMSWPALIPEWFGALADGVTDAQPQLQAAINFTALKGASLQLTAGEYLIERPLYVTTSGNSPFRIYGVSQYTSSIRAGASLESASKPDMSGGTYALSLSYTPVLALNVTTGVCLEDFQIDGGDYDVYGLYVNESFFFNHSRIRIKSCNQRPFTFVRCQSGTFESMQSIINGQGVSPDGSTLFYDCSSLSVISPSMERTGTSRYAMEIFQPNNKGGISIISPWFEVLPTGTAPDLGFFSAGGRNVNMVAPYSTFANRWVDEDLVHLKGSADTLSTDGITMTTFAAVGCSIEVNDASTVSMNITLESDTGNNLISGFFDSAKIVNLATGRANNFYPKGFTVPNKRQFFGGGLRIVEEADGSGYDPNRYILDCDSSSAAGPINLFNNANNRLFLNAGILELQSNLDLRLIGGANVNIRPNDTAGNNAVISTATGVSDWEKGHLRLGGYHLWVDATGDLRIKNGAPTSDTDGVVVGTQT